MIRHLVLFSVPDTADLPTVRATLSTLAEIPSVRAFELGENERLDEFSDEMDFAVHAVFDDADALAAFKEHPIYRRSTAIVRPLRGQRVAVDYDISASAASPPPRPPSGDT